MIMIFSNWESVSYCVCRARTIKLGPTRATGSTRSLVADVGEPGWAKSPVGDVWAGLRLELGPTRATGSTWSLVVGVGWAKSPVGDVWAGLRLELGPTRATESTWSPVGVLESQGGPSHQLGMCGCG